MINSGRIKRILLYSDSNLLEFFISISVGFFIFSQNGHPLVSPFFLYGGLFMVLSLFYGNSSNNIVIRSLSLRLISAWFISFIVIDVCSGVFSLQNNYYLIEVTFMSIFSAYRVGRELNYREVVRGKRCQKI
tara:strand:+ start:48072 stop:48467 length:396 start_codon:yes stop_codon:yes gene_type:complete